MCRYNNKCHILGYIEGLVFIHCINYFYVRIWFCIYTVFNIPIKSLDSDELKSINYINAKIIPYNFYSIFLSKKLWGLLGFNQ